MFPWIKLALVALNVGTSATLGGVTTYYLFGKSNKKHEGKDFEEIKSELKKAEEEFKKENEEIQAKNEKKIKDLEAQIIVLKRVENCLGRMEESYKRTIEDLGWRRWFKNVRYGGEHCV